MKSVPPRGSGWVPGLPIADCQMPIGFLSKGNWQSKIGNWQCKKPTRYREVVLTSLAVALNIRPYRARFCKEQENKNYEHRGYRTES